jgi:16S rRNA (cytidine1402-2'-O)-methyltransferase
VALEAGILYVVATPIGNLGDVTQRALETLREVDWIAAEDTRHTRRLLAHFGIATRLVAVHEHNEAGRAAALAQRLLRGETGAFVVDAGSPGVSDPGARLVRAVATAGARVRVVPGPSAVVSALSLAGFVGDAFTFAGFPPAKAAARRARLEELVQREETIVLYEAPHRVRATLTDLAALVPDRPLAACRELTKVHEEVLRGSAREVAASLREEQERGEWVLVLAGPTPDEVRSRRATQATQATRAAATTPRRGGRDARPAREDSAARARFVAAQVESGATRDEAERRADFVLGGRRGSRPSRPRNA